MYHLHMVLISHDAGSHSERMSVPLSGDYFISHGRKQFLFPFFRCQAKRKFLKKT